MKLTFRKQIMVSIFFFFLLSSTFGQVQKKELLIGKWTFEKFDFSGELANVRAIEQKNANTANIGLVITFFPDNKYQSRQKNGMKENNVTGRYKLLTDDKLIILGDTSKIIQLDKNSLKLYSDSKRPIVSFKRSQ